MSPVRGPAARPVLVANCSGFFGDRRNGAREVVEGGPIDVLTGDWLAELTMLVLAKSAARGRPGWAGTFLRDLEPVLGTIVDRGIRVVANAGGLDPAGCAAAVRDLAARLGLDVEVAHIEGDDLRGRFDDMRAAGWEAVNIDTGEPFAVVDTPALSANAYLGGWGIAGALAAGAQVVVTGRVTDAAVVEGAAAWWHGWGVDDLDALAGAVVAGHVIECGAQATGGNFAFFTELADPVHPGLPIAEIDADGSSVITKHPGTGGAVTVDTITAQLLYEVGGPRYANPDAVTDLSSITLSSDGPDRVRISGVRGLAPPPTLKVALNADGGYRNSMTFYMTGLDADAKAAFVEQGLWDAVPGGEKAFERVERTWWRAGRDDPATNVDALSSLTITVHHRDERVVGRAFSDSAVGLVLSSIPGMFLGSPPGPGQAVGLYWPTLVERAEVDHAWVDSAGHRHAVPSPATAPLPVDDDEPGVSAPREVGPCTRAPLGTILGARSGDKGGNANLGVWARTDDAHQWLDAFLTTERLRELLPDVCDGREVRRHRLPNLRALNFIVVGLLGRGVASCDRPDAQAKGLGEYLRAKVVDIPDRLLTP